MASNLKNSKLPDVEAQAEDELQYGHGPMTMEELDEPYLDKGGRPRNHSKTFPFHELFISLFDPLTSNKAKPTGPSAARAKRGPHGPNKLSPHEQRRSIIERFISRWRNEVGDDFYPALRLIVPEKDRDRAMYGLKEKAIGKILVKLLKISPDSEDGKNLLNWKLPGQTAAKVAGNFPERCKEVLSKRAMRSDVGDMRIAEVNSLLDKLSAAGKEEAQMQIFETFYNRMNADEMHWLICIILRQMKVGASERTFLDLWHPDGEALFSVSSSLRKVCWDLIDPGIRLDHDSTLAIKLMQCFQPQLAQFQTHSFQKMIDKLGSTEDDPTFWIEEKLDGERMQLHMMADDSVMGGYRLAFWSRKAKDYTYLYGDGFQDDNSALTRHIKDAFDPRLRNIILDGEMITWDPTRDMMVGFGTLKTAAISEQKNPYDGSGHRPLFRVFDCLFMNDQDLTRYTLRDRRKALEGAVTDVYRRIEIHKYQEAKSASDIEPALRKVVAEASEGLVLKNPRSIYRLNSRNDDWVKVKPEYMTEFGESLDCVVIGGYYGSGHRGGNLSSFLCGLRVGKNYKDAHKGTNPMKCLSFFKVGGGFRAEDYASVRHRTDGKWVVWDKNNPPNEFVELGGGDRQFERPDVWIKPSESVVLEVKAASIGGSDQFAFQYTLRFPRFKRLRLDKNWEDALSVDEFILLKAQVEEESKKKEFRVDMKRKLAKKLKKELLIAGNDSKVKAPYAGPKTALFEGLKFCILSEMLHPEKKSKGEIEQLIKVNGGSIFQSPAAEDNIICIGDKKVVKVASLVKSGSANIVRPSWLLDALQQAEVDGPDKPKYLIPFEPNHLFHITEADRRGIGDNIDVYGDSYARDITSHDLKRILDDMIHPKNYEFCAGAFLSELEERGKGLGEVRASMFRNCVIRFYPRSDNLFQADSRSELELQIAKHRFLFASGTIAGSDDDGNITHFICPTEDEAGVKDLRTLLSERSTRLPRIVGLNWLQESWAEGTLLDEERYAV